MSSRCSGVSGWTRQYRLAKSACNHTAVLSRSVEPCRVIVNARQFTTQPFEHLGFAGWSTRLTLAEIDTELLSLHGAIPDQSNLPTHQLHVIQRTITADLCASPPVSQKPLEQSAEQPHCDAINTTSLIFLRSAKAIVLPSGDQSKTVVCPTARSANCRGVLPSNGCSQSRVIPSSFAM